MGPVVVAMTNTVGRVELLTWLKTFLGQISTGEVRPIQLCTVYIMLLYHTA